MQTYLLTMIIMIAWDINTCITFETSACLRWARMLATKMLEGVKHLQLHRQRISNKVREF